VLKCIKGSIFDVIVDCRKGSDTFLQWYGVELSAENKRQLLVPIGFAHGYAVLSATAEVFYKCDAFYNKELEGGLLYNDETVKVDWKLNINEAIVSEKDKVQPILAAVKCNF
jgi:dTDP-4-dehydrorhamnose 3,5-epimerase